MSFKSRLLRLERHLSRVQNQAWPLSERMQLLLRNCDTAIIEFSRCESEVEREVAYCRFIEAVRELCQVYPNNGIYELVSEEQTETPNKQNPRC